MNVRKLLWLGCACLSSHFALFAQTHDKTGYYIDMKGDTVFGKFINYQESFWSPSSLSFQARGAQSPSTLTPGQCKRVAVDQSDNLVSYQGKRQTNSINYQDNQIDSGDTFVDISAFLLELYNNGHYHLFQFVDKRRPNFYISEGEGPLRELSYKEFINNSRVVQWPGFRLQLEDLFRSVLQDKPRRQALIDNVAYTASALTRLFNKMAEGSNLTAHKGKYPAQLFVGAGLSSNLLKVTGGPFVGPVLANEPEASASQTSPLFEIGLRLFSQRNHGRLFFTIHPAYYHFHQSYVKGNFSGTADSNTFTSNVLSIPLGIGYKLIDKENFSFELSGGPSMSLFFQNTETWATTPVIYSSDILHETGRSSAFTFFGEAAIELFKRLSVYVSYFPPVSTTNSSSYDVDHGSLRFGARVRVF